MIDKFGAKHRLKVRIDPGDGTKIIPGRLGHIYEHTPEENLMGLMLMLKSARAWGFASRRLEEAGMKIVQRGDWEGCATFDTNNKAQAILAIREAKIRRKALFTNVRQQNLSKSKPYRFKSGGK